MIRTIAFALAFLLLASACAEAREPAILQDTATGFVVVWRGKATASDVRRLFDDGKSPLQNPSSFKPYLACIVATGTRAAVLLAGYAFYSVGIIDGPHAGCKGFVGAGFIH